MRRVAKLLKPLAAATATGAPAPGSALPASGFLTIGGTTYIDPAGHYPLGHLAGGSATLVINDTDQHITIVTESDHDPCRDHDGAQGRAPGRAADIVLAPGGRTETRRGHSVHVGWGRAMGGG
ncbi:hypothetical protein [Streptomyces sp. NPDC048650]|uniref:hypothetical protein n=1 Tax=unclassified Streptomyces TaxID=2593676 RepID=UPI003710FB57